MAINFDEKSNGLFSDNKGANLVPRAIIVIGSGDEKSVITPLTYSLSTHYEFDTDSFSFTLPMDLIDLSEIYRQSMKQGKVIPVEVWSGFLDINDKHLSTFDSQYDSNFISNDKLLDELLDTYEDVLNRRWVGVLGQPELSYGDIDSKDIIKVNCYDYSIILKRAMYEREFKDKESRVDNIINEINKQLNYFTFKFDNNIQGDLLDNIKNTIMGFEFEYNKDDSDTTTKEISYNTSGKSYYQILKDICERTRTTIVFDTKASVTNGKITYLITKRLSSDKGWKLFRSLHFTELNIRAGGYATNPSPKIAIECLSKNTEKGTTVRGSYPINLTKESPERQKFISVVLEDNLSTEILRARAFDIASNLARQELTGDLYLPNAFLNIYPKHIINLNDGTDLVRNRSIKQYADYNFVVSSIMEEYDYESSLLSQRIEFELDMVTNQLDTTGNLKAIDIFKQESNTNQKKSGKIKNLSDTQSIQIVDKGNVPSYLKRLRDKGLM